MGALKHTFPNADLRPSSPGDGTTNLLFSNPLSVGIVLLAGLCARIYQAYAYFFDPDEALHTLLASYNSTPLTFKATLTTAHPPLLIIFLHYWRFLGHSEFMLRLPSVIVGTLSCWLLYLWLKKITDERTAFIALLLCSFAPALIELSAQVRQYAILNFFIAAALYCTERALEEDSALFINLFSVSLCGAVLTHYSGFLFVFAMGLYLLVRLRPWRARPQLFAIWAGGQAVVAALCIFFLLVHIPRLKQAGMPQGIAETWLRRSIYHPGESSLAIFPLRQTLRVFTYLFSHGFIGTLALVVFVVGVVSLVRTKTLVLKGPSAREVSFLIATPFLLNCILAIAGIYPYGGTRHDVYLASFAIAGISLELSLRRPKHIGWEIGVLVVGLAICNLFPAPPPLIRARDHRKALMNEAIESLKTQAPPGSTVFVGYQSGLEFGYYVCRQNIVQVFFPLERFSRTSCGPYTVIASWPHQWQFEAGELTPALNEVVDRYQIPSGTRLWLFEAGWSPANPAKVAEELSSLGCEPQRFGHNIRICAITVRKGQ